MPERETVQTLCRMCDDRCAINVYLEDGKIVDIDGYKEHPWNRGRLCVKARAAVDMVYHPERLLKPLKRTKRDLAGPQPCLKVQPWGKESFCSNGLPVI